MTATVYNLTDQWQSSARYTAATQIDVALIDPAPGLARIAFTTTMSDTAPTITPADAAKVPRDGYRPITLNSGERLWMAVYGQATGRATLEV